MRLLGGLLACLATVLATAAFTASVAQPAAPAAATASPPRAGRLLPPDATTHHVLDLPGHSLRFTAVAGALPLADAGKPTAELAFVAYTLDGADTHSRPVTFVTNGGPGAASAWLHLGALGPWRLPMDGAARAPSASPVLVDNPDTWLDFTDLVFLDPPGAGYSRLADDTEALRRRAWSVSGDASGLAEAIRRWLDANGRLASPKFYAGESYGGLRGPLLARALASEQGVGLSGLVLISPFMDDGLRDSALPVIDLVDHLPPMAAAARHLGPDALAEVEAYATGDYLRDLLLGGRDPAVLDRISARVAAYTGLDPALVRRHRGRVAVDLFLREQKPGALLSRYDATLAMPDAFPEAAAPRLTDPVFAQFAPPLTSAIVDLLSNRLNWRVDAKYELDNDRVFREWDWGHGMGRPESLTALRRLLAADPGFRVLIGHGIYDLVTPYLGTKLLLAQLPGDDAAGRVHLALHEGGHMFYTRDDSRAALHDEARALVTGH